ncbi:MAG TPA: hypothetical protein VJ792_03820 [Candidatus Nitrosotalea sp.]|nr:hypothetical protein [Candidatus Nitrosotalea sp.]
MKRRSDTVDLIWVSANFSSVFFTEKEVKHFLSSLAPKNGDTFTGLSIEFFETHLNKRYAKSEVMNATPEQLRNMITLT